MKDAPVPEDQFCVRQTGKDYIAVMSNNTEVCNVIKNTLLESRTQFYTFTPKKDKKISLVLKEIRSEYDEGDIKTFLDKKDLQNSKIERVTKPHFDKENKSKFFFIL